MSRSASALGSAAAAVLLVYAGSAPAGAVGPPTQTAPLPISDAPLAIHDRPLTIDLPVSSLDNSVSFHNIGVVLQADVLFAFNSSRLTGKAGSRIAQAVANIHKRHPRALRIQGYTDSIGTQAYNLGLSQRRARAVLNALRDALGAGAPPMTAVGYGEADPVAANTNPDGSDDPRGRALNRRVEIHYLG
jgi:outer membrane protein OmpA-like peptidoglycan-associated protein